MMACVSYTTLPKRVRRSLDAVLVFSLPMKGDLKVLTWEYTNNTRVAEFALRRLEDHQCLVLETLTRRQKLAVWKATFFTVSDVRMSESLESVRSQTKFSYERPEVCPSSLGRLDKRVTSDYTQSREDCERAGVQTANSVPTDRPGSDPEDPE